MRNNRGISVDVNTLGHMYWRSILTYWVALNDQSLQQDVIMLLNITLKISYDYCPIFD